VSAMYPALHALYKADDTTDIYANTNTHKTATNFNGMYIRFINSSIHYNCTA